MNVTIGVDPSFFKIDCLIFKGNVSSVFFILFSFNFYMQMYTFNIKYVL